MKVTTTMTMMSKKINSFKYILIFGFLLVTNQANAHKFYMSITDMNYNSTTKSLQVAIKFFADDLELVLEKETGERILIGTENENTKTSDFISTYLKSHFIIEQNKGSLTPIFVGNETDKDYTWVYLEFKNFEPNESTSLTNTVLIEYFSKQANKVNFTKGKRTKSYTLHRNNITTEL